MSYNTGKPEVTGLYYVDREAQGQAYRWYNAETDQWGMCCFEISEALDNKDKTAVGFFPWTGPFVGKKYR